jgi:hypothetical protein
LQLKTLLSSAIIAYARDTKLETVQILERGLTASYVVRTLMTLFHVMRKYVSSAIDPDIWLHSAKRRI